MKSMSAIEWLYLTKDLESPCSWIHPFHEGKIIFINLRYFPHVRWHSIISHYLGKTELQDSYRLQNLRLFEVFCNPCTRLLREKLTSEHGTMMGKNVRLLSLREVPTILKHRIWVLSEFWPCVHTRSAEGKCFLPLSRSLVQ